MYMTLLAILLILWCLYPFFGIPFAVSVSSKNNKLKERIDELEAENRKLRNEVSDDGKSLCPDFSEEENNIPQMDHTSEDTDSVTKLDMPVQKEDLSLTALREEVMKEHEEKRKERNISGLLITGVSLVLLAGLIFVTTNWSAISDGFKIFLIFLVTVLFFGVSVFAEKKLGLESTSKGFFILGTLFVPVSCLSLIFFQIFGSWFSFGGEGKMLALMSVFLSCSVSCGLITGKYRNHISAFFTMLFVSAAVCSFAFFAATVALEFSFAVFFIIAVIYSAVLLLVKKEMLSRLEIPFVYTDVYSLFSKLNAFIFALISIIAAAADDSTGEAAAAVAFLFAITLFLKTLTENVTTKGFLNAVSAVEYFVFSLLASDALSDKFGWDYDITFLMTVLICVPALALLTLVPKFRSGLSQSVLNILLFITAMCNFEDCSIAGCVILLLMIIVSTVSENKVYKTVTASVMSIPLFAQIILLMNQEDILPVLLSFIVSVFFLSCVVFGRKISRLRPASAVFAVYSALIPLVTAAGEPDDLIKLSALLISSAAFALAAVMSGLEMQKVRTAVYTAAFSIQFQIFAYLIAEQHLFADFDPALYDDAHFPLYLTSFAVMALIMMTGIFAGRFDRVISKTLVSSSALIPFIALIMYTPYGSGNWPMVFELVFAAYFLVSGFAYSGGVSKLMWSVSSAVLAFAAATQNLVEIDDWFRIEYYVICSFIPYIFLRFIWKNEKDVLDSVKFVHSCIGIGVLAVNAMISGELSHALFIGFVCVVLILTGFITGQKKWSKLGTVTLILLVLYMTRDFWASIAWWVYLLTAGVTLITYAGINEYCRKTGKENVIKTGIKNVISKAFEKE